MATPELLIDDVIGEDLFWSGITSRGVNRWLSENAKASEVIVRMNSPGGDVFEGMAIYTALKRSGARVIVEVEGVAASAASLIAMAADEIRVQKGAQIMIHEAATRAFGPAEVHERAADMLKKINGEVADLYAARSGQTRESVLSLMADETWLTADDAKALGFCDTIIPAKSAPSKAPRNSAGARMLAAYRHAPESVIVAAMERMNGVLRAEETVMDEKQFLMALGVSTVAELQTRLAVLGRIELAVGKQGDEAHGIVLAAMQSHAELPKARERITQLEQTAEKHELDKLLAKANDEKKLTPAIRESVLAAFAGKDITLKGIESMLSNLAPIAAFADRKEAAPAVATASASAVTWNGKSYKDLKPSERAALKREDPTLFKQMSSNPG